MSWFPASDCLWSRGKLGAVHREGGIRADLVVVGAGTAVASLPVRNALLAN